MNQGWNTLAIKKNDMIWASLVTQTIKNLQCRRSRFNPWIGKISWRREWQPSILAWRIPMDTGTWRVTVHRVAKSRTRLSD